LLAGDVPSKKREDHPPVAWSNDCKGGDGLDYRSVSSVSHDEDAKSIASIESIEEYLDKVFNMTSLGTSCADFSSFLPSPMPSRYDYKGDVVSPKILRKRPTVTRRIYVATHAVLPKPLQKPINGFEIKVREVTEHCTVRCRVRIGGFRLHGRFRQMGEQPKVSLPAALPADNRKICLENQRIPRKERRTLKSRWQIL
jgi:hypothetical protein